MLKRLFSRFLVFGIVFYLGFVFLIGSALVEASEGEKEGFRPGRGEWLEMEGDVRVDFISPQTPLPYVELDRADLILKATVTEGVYSRVILRFSHPLGGPFAGEVAKAYTRFSLENHWLRVGLTPRFIRPGDMDRGSMKTVGHPLIGSAFWRDEQFNLTFSGVFPAGGDLRYFLSYGSGLAVGHRFPSEHLFPYIPHPAPEAARRADYFFADRERARAQRGDEIGVGLGYRYHFGKGTLDFVGFGLFSRIPITPEIPSITAPIGTLAGVPTFTIPTMPVAGLINWPARKRQQRIGGRIVYRKGESLLMAEYIDAQDGRLRRDGWYVQASHKIEFRPLIGERFFTAIEPLIRYGRYYVHLPTGVAREFTNPITWNRSQLTLALLCDIAKNVDLRIEYDINDEVTGNRRIDNNEFRVQLRTRF